MKFDSFVPNRTYLFKVLILIASGYDILQCLVACVNNVLTYFGFYDLETTFDRLD
jgi:hypothetical protein